MHRVLLTMIGLVACGLGFTACGGGDATPVTTQQVITTTPEAEVIRPPQPDFVVLVVGDTISGGGRKTVKLGTTVRIQVVSDAKDELHLHGYDRKVDLVAGRPATLTFVADVPGIFEVELESRSLKLLDLVVR